MQYCQYDVQGFFQPYRYLKRKLQGTRHRAVRLLLEQKKMGLCYFVCVSLLYL